MKTINTYINEKLNISTEYTCKPKDKYELKDIIEERLKKDKDANLNDIDVSSVTNMSNLFYRLDPHNIDISEWDVSNVTNMYSMFNGCKKFNSDLNKWNVSSVTDMSYMFYGCNKFNSDISNWNVSNVKIMYKMFYKCDSLKNKPKWYEE